MSQPFVGEIRLFAGSFAPNGWMLCQGQVLPISEYETLFNLIGTTYGGDGQETFRLPDLQSRVPIHQGTRPGGSTYQIGETGGSESVTLSPQQMPIHSHGFGVVQGLPGTQVSPAGSVPAMSLNVVPYINEAVVDPGQAANRFAPGAITPIGGNQPHENMQPYLTINFIISLFGVFPSQS
ncbi:tail fiber protein [Nocardioides sp. WV_118_6]|uniref:phage tail protein n=1 Tax=Nocardioides simplex TaxID=2045 RepID=UPI0021501337|nr:tail fiber protein [Pimelobacter simplex]UUW89110.1 tail fiber protein [Pimelobacter simplex]UUW98614.1 tail fiber protein [Pimelobacter simplex]